VERGAEFSNPMKPKAWIVESAFACLMAESFEPQRLWCPTKNPDRKSTRVLKRSYPTDAV
jgi:hypothetical protein